MEDSPVRAVLNAMLKRLVDHEASDLYVSVGSPPILRLEGELLPLPMDVVTANQCEQIAALIMTDKQRETFSRDLEMNLVHDAAGIGRFRVNVHKDRGNVGIVLRRVPTKIPTIEELNLPSQLRKIALSDRGLILVAGPAGVGKSTTLAAMIDCLNQNKAYRIITIEDPIEFLHTSKKSLICQREVGIDTHSFQDALRSAVRQSPHVLLIGEMRDRESVEAAVLFAESGHLVLSTIHANNAPQTIERVLNFFPQNQHQQIAHLMAQHLKAVISQRLAKGENLAGMIPVVEIMMNHPRIAELIRKLDFAKIKETMAFVSGDGISQTFDQHLLALCATGTLSAEEAVRISDSPNDLRLQLKTQIAPAVPEEKVEEKPVEKPPVYPGKRWSGAEGGT